MEKAYLISDAAKQVQVETHVLRYWEEELHISVNRTQMGHRYYTQEDIQLFRCIKKLKDEGVPSTIINLICYGIPSVAEARFKRDCAEGVYKANQEAINTYKLKIRLIEAQLSREWVNDTPR
mgnify:CR=1 FL=1